MDARRWRQIERLYHEVAERPMAERLAFLAEACAGDDALRHDIEELLRGQPIADGVFAGHALTAAPRMLSHPASALLTGQNIGVYPLLTRIASS